jgi:hypothetical protein
MIYVFLKSSIYVDHLDKAVDQLAETIHKLKSVKEN